jgi:hypothetical protein
MMAVSITLMICLFIGHQAMVVGFAVKENETRLKIKYWVSLAQLND